MNISTTEQPLTLRGLASRAGELAIGPARTALALLAVLITFSLLTPTFMTSINLNNLFLQVAAVAAISVGVVMVLLLGEIDLSLGSISGLVAAIAAVLIVRSHVHAVLAIVIALSAGAVIGLIQGMIVTYLQLPSFIVTLAGLLIWQGALLAVLGTSGTTNVSDPIFTGLAGTFLPDSLSITLAAVGALLFAAKLVLQHRRRAAFGLTDKNVVSRVVMPLAALVVLVGLMLWVFLSDRGVPLSVVIVLAAALAMSIILRSTRYGQHVYAVGGNREAAKRLGIRVNAIRIGAFVLAASFAGLGGILAASRLQASTQNSGGNDLLLLAIAGPVIAGVSLFGGRGNVWAAPIGALIIGGIANGMDLLNLSSQTKYIVTGVVLIVAVAFDALARMARRRRGLA